MRHCQRKDVEHTLALQHRVPDLVLVLPDQDRITADHQGGLDHFLAEGIAQELGRANGDVFSAMGRMNDLQNALTFALEANVNLSANPSLQAIA